ncbi:unnamed protein product [Coregonus sp. 'balchen']|nr:unnamed protein product [Coregonus sp. 'balchen']
MEKQFYDTDVHVEVLSEQLNGDYSHITMRTWWCTAWALAWPVFPDLDRKKINDAFLLACPLVELT